MHDTEKGKREKNEKQRKLMAYSATVFSLTILYAQILFSLKASTCNVSI